MSLNKPLTFGVFALGFVVPIAAAGAGYSGRYVLLQQTATMAKAPVVGTLIAKSRAVSLHDLTHSAGRLRGTGKLCDLTLDSGSRLVRTIMPAALKRALPQPYIDAKLSRKRGQTIFDQGKQTVVLGARLRRPLLDSIPRSTSDPRVYDQDGDGHPGVTMQIEGIVNGQIHLVQRNWSVLQGTPMRHGFAGRIRFGTERAILGTTSWMLDDPPEARPNPARSYFRLVRVGKQTSCRDATKLAKAW